MQRVARVTMQSNERWIICWSMLRHSVTIASRSCLKLFGYSSCGTHSKSCVLNIPKGKNHTLWDQKSGETKPNHHVYWSLGQEIDHEDILHCRVTGVRRSFILLPEHGISIDVVNGKISLYDVVTYDPQILSGVKVSLNKVGTQNNSCPCQTNPNHYLICSFK